MIHPLPATITHKNAAVQRVLTQQLSTGWTRKIGEEMDEKMV